MSASPCAIRRSTIVQVTRPPIGLWRFHWHELFPIARENDGNGKRAIYLPEVEAKDGRRELCSRLQSEFADLPPESEFPIVVEGCMVAVLDGDRTGLLPDFQEAEIDAILSTFSSDGQVVTQRTDAALDLR